jgi:UDP-2,4-diacetamido-2,4,6-trideoxy-beta-L-altropyranose hydrolase
MELIIRTDADSKIGTGHFMRCLALGQAWLRQVNNNVTFVCAKVDPLLRQRLKTEKIDLIQCDCKIGSLKDARSTLRIFNNLQGFALVLDGYQFDTTYQRFLNDNQVTILIIDDNGGIGPYYADFILNQNIHADRRLYKERRDDTELLLGTEYVLLRKEFIKYRQHSPRVPDTAKRVLVTIGGSDNNNVTSVIIYAIAQISIPAIEYVVVIGTANPHLNKIQQLVSKSKNVIDIHHNVPDMAKLMSWSEVSVSAGGSTCWEFAYMGIPSLVLTVADNQNDLVKHLTASGAIMNLGWFQNMKPDVIAKKLIKLIKNRALRKMMSARGKELIDGWGADRTKTALMTTAIQLKTAANEDCRLVWEWANDPQVRSVSFKSEKIPWEEHVKWFHEKINNRLSRFYIAQISSGRSVGQVRFDLSSKEAAISITVDKAYRKLGYGSAIIRKACLELFRQENVDTINAFVKNSNRTSQVSFLNAGFKEIEEKFISGYSARHFVLLKDKIL